MGSGRLQKVTAAGSELWSIELPGEAWNLAIDSSNNIVVAGMERGFSTLAGTICASVAQVDAAGRLVSATSIVPVQPFALRAIAVDQE